MLSHASLRRLARSISLGTLFAVVCDASISSAADERSTFTQIAEKQASTTDPAAENGAFLLRPRFQIEKLFTVPKETLGSWVAITFDNRGRLLAGDQGGLGLCRITPASLDGKTPTTVERLDVKITSAQGLLYAFDSLYLSVNGGPGSGLYRAKDNESRNIDTLHPTTNRT